ncbi:receptor-like protein 3 [Pyrus communis]|uniref:receptor-like protein 3 n=1 Tax=Pyrus communis TaxID=23211 RepID=UPI0035BEBC34
MDLSSNHFHGPIPSSFFQQAWNLTSFNVSNNTFSGHIPSSVCLRLHPSIRVLDFSSNEFSGNISPGFGGCFKLQILRAGHNNLSKSLPKDIYNATKLEELSLPLNSLNGAISERIANLAHLTILDLNSNHLNGVLPLNFGKLFKLKFMNFDFNSLQGNMPPSLMNYTNFVELHLESNYLEGDLTKLNFSKLSCLSKLDLSWNNFTGIFPISLYSCRSLKAIRLSENPYLEGQTQPEILLLKSLSFLSLVYVRLTNITVAMKILMCCKSLHTLLLTGSFDRETMPTVDEMIDFHGFQNLRVLSLAGCGLNGQIPGWLSNLQNLEVLDLGYNQIIVSLPSPPYDHISYSDHCDSNVPRATPSGYVGSQILKSHTGYYTGGSGILSQRSSFQPYHEPENSIEFTPSSVQTTYVPGLFMIEGSLRFQRSSVFDYVGNVSKSLRPSSVSFELSGFWSESSGKICMVGSGSNYLAHGRGLYYPAVLKLYNVMSSTSVTSLITGTLESSMSSESNPKYFGPVSI